MPYMQVLFAISVKTPEFAYSVDKFVQLDAVKKEKSLCVFIDARGGCGKTFLLNTILDAVRSSESEGCVALAMATTGLAANLLPLGRTFHSRMKVHLRITFKTNI